jgi:uncharacterized protein with HEPN domain
VKPSTSDNFWLRERLEEIRLALQRILRRFEGVHSANDFTKNEEGVDRLDAICMLVLAVGEAFRQIDQKTDGKWLARYPEIEWQGVIAVRNVIAHGYFDIEVEAIYGICQSDVPLLLSTVTKMLNDAS